MSILVDHEIRARTRLPADSPQRLTITPWTDYDESPDGAIGYGLTSAGYDVRFGLRWLIFTNAAGIVVDPKAFDPQHFVEREVPAGLAVVIPPNSFALAESLEWIEMPEDCVAHLCGKSTLARVAVNLNTTAVEPAWRGRLTLEVINGNPLPVKVYAGEGAGQMQFHRLDERCERTYETRRRRLYQDQRGLQGPRHLKQENQHG